MLSPLALYCILYCITSVSAAWPLPSLAQECPLGCNQTVRITLQEQRIPLPWTNGFNSKSAKSIDFQHLKKRKKHKLVLFYNKDAGLSLALHLFHSYASGAVWTTSKPLSCARYWPSRNLSPQRQVCVKTCVSNCNVASFISDSFPQVNQPFLHFVWQKNPWMSLRPIKCRNSLL